MKTYVPSVRNIPGLGRAPVLADANLNGEWVPPTRIYLADDVDKEMERLREKVRVLQLRDDYVSGCLV